MGNHRFVVLAVLGALLVGGLSGCSAVGAIADLGTQGRTIGQQAVGFTDTSTAAPGTGGWTSSTPCPAELQSGLKASLPAGSTVTVLDPASAPGLVLAPDIARNDVASCAFSIVDGGLHLNELYFLGMDPSYVAPIAAQLTSEGFVAQPPTAVANGTRTVYAGPRGRAVIESLSENGIPFYIVGG